MTSSKERSTTVQPTISAHAIAAALGQFPPTDEQVAVIESPLSPALVVAGAGSGKTETMASRVVWLVANGLVARDEILGLTFTRKAAGELSERIHRRLTRLDDFGRHGLLPRLGELHSSGMLQVFSGFESTGDEAARFQALADLQQRFQTNTETSVAVDLLSRPTVSTYNSFADAIVREHAVRAGRDPEAVVLSESAAWLMMRRTLLSSDDSRLEERSESLRSIVDAALRIARDGVDNGADFDSVDAYAREFSSVRERPSTNARTTVYADIAEAERRVSALPLLTALARDYAALKQRNGVIDFSDQVAGALDLVGAYPATAAEIRSRYRVVLLDEYQDTSVAQTELLATLFRGGAVMAVGDPHQAIYGWRGASAGNLGGFSHAFGRSGDAQNEEACRVSTFSLLTSWRNGSDILKVANALLEPLAARSPVSVGELQPRSGAPLGEVQIALDSDIDSEADRVAAWFAGMRAGGKTPKTSAVLFRSKRHMTRFADALGAYGVPHRILGLGGLLSTPEVVDVVSALRVVCEPTAGSALIRLLAGPRWSIGLSDLRALASLARRLATHDAALRPLSQSVSDGLRNSSDGDRGTLADALDFIARHRDDHRWLEGFTPLARERLRDAGATFAGLRRAADAPIPELIRLIEIELRLDIELAANETRGPARIASAQLRAFLAEVHGFLAADESGSIPSLLAWLEHAEQVDEFAPRTEPPESDVVQLLTIHGSKGLEWDAVAVVRMVEDELPTAAKDTKGWLTFGVLPYDFRGDVDWLPMFAWRSAETQQDLKAALEASVDAHRNRQLDEDRRLAYVAVTRARDRLLLTGSAWSGTKRPRRASRFLEEAAHVLDMQFDVQDPGDDPYADERRTLSWPLDALGSRAERVVAAADLVEQARVSIRAAPTRDLALLLAERDALSAPAVVGRAPTRIPASRYKEFVHDYAGAVAAIERPLPERPYRQTRRGTLFHAWVEQRSGRSSSGGSLDDALWEVEDGEQSADAGDATALAELQRRFEASEWGSRQPIAVETEIDFTFVGLDERPHIAICKIDAVYVREDRGNRIEIVDWKTGAPPRTAAEKEARMLQIELYRRAYNAKYGVPMDDIDVALYYVAHDIVVRG
ncbi:DNA helicase-2/ATP-dependent DNA helicase PcrA [Microbacterium endophyticum]|uniref:DNA 3'-5' helicase n=1 Tax=Microbacterium endophyticum TaxID=1526412 RepID=A0A7W4V1E3_9MICO|nr:UvrD-helicase domain-containing protein [Microbacterium endophyticum]MBB2974764.1 DNA helicase-2/ATP-dependent DNA helicase PcrA [Microbacterium endophyticum]NIK37061.1 DNA helicase-2/ATP-dependent DNA helicase PcrA [Microbacterium endophyticum]